MSSLLTRSSTLPPRKMVRLGDYVAKTEETDRSPLESGFDRYLKVDHLDKDRLRIVRWGSILAGELPPTFYKVFRKGQVLYPTRNPHLRRTAYASFDGICGEKTLTLSAKPGMDPKFLPFIFQTEDFIDFATSMMIGSTNPHVRWRDIAKFEFSLPPLEEQKRIAEILWAAEEAAETFESALLELDVLAFVYGEKNFLLHEARKRRPKLPKGWKIGSLADIAIIDPGMPRGLPDGLEISFLPMEYLAEGGGINSQERKMLGEVRKGYTYFEENDILFAKITPCMENGKGALAEGLHNNKGMGSTEYYVFRALDASDISFLYQLSTSRVFRTRAERWMQGSAGQRRVPKEFFTRRPIVIPDPESRIRIGAKLKSLELLRGQLRQNITLIRATAAAFREVTLKLVEDAHV